MGGCRSWNWNLRQKKGTSKPRNRLSETWLNAPDYQMDYQMDY